MRTIDLFAGCGGMSLGFQQVGCNIVAAFDKWESAVEVYRQNFEHPIFQIDLATLADLSCIRDLEPDVIIGGPPCQDFSSAGKRDESLGRADLTIQFAQIVADVQPTWFVMENVERIVKSRVLRLAKRILHAAGYGLTDVVLNASLCGVPQNRKRFFLIGEMNGTDNAITPYLFQNLAAEPMTVHDYLGDSLGIEHYYRHPRSYQRRGVFSIHEPSPTVRGVNRPIPSTYQSHVGDTALVTPELRPLTTLERSYLQTFPRDFVFEGSKTDLEQMIGNAVPVNLAKHVVESILAYQRDKQAGKILQSDAIQLPLL